MRTKYVELRDEVERKFKELVSQRPYEFFTGETFQESDREDWEYGLYQVHDTATGRVYDAYVLRVDLDGVQIAEEDDISKVRMISFQTIASILEKIFLIEEMQRLADKKEFSRKEIRSILLEFAPFARYDAEEGKWTDIIDKWMKENL